MAFKLKTMEAAVTASATALSISNIGTRLDLLDTEFGDGIILTDIKRVYTAEVKDVPEYPSLFILGEDSVPNQTTFTHYRFKNNLTLVILATDQDPEKLRKRLYRYVRALAELMIESMTTNGYQIVIGQFNYSPLFTKEGEFLGDASLKISMTKFEETSYA